MRGEVQSLVPRPSDLMCRIQCTGHESAKMASHGILGICSILQTGIFRLQASSAEAMRKQETGCSARNSGKLWAPKGASEKSDTLRACSLFCVEFSALLIDTQIHDRLLRSCALMRKGHVQLRDSANLMSRIPRGCNRTTTHRSSVVFSYSPCLSSIVNVRICSSLCWGI